MTNTITTQSGATFTAEDNVTLLDAFQDAELKTPYSCQNGRCSACKCKVLSGETVALTEELGLGEDEKSDGWILSCVRQAKSDLVLDVQDLSHLNIATPRTLSCKINYIGHLTPDIMHIQLRLPPKTQFEFLAGQFVEIVGRNGIRRSYSIASDPSRSLLDFHIRIVEDGVLSAYWRDHAKVGDLLRLRGPLGTFFLRDFKEKEIVFLATGTGIAPVLSMLGSLLQVAPDDRPRSIKVFWGGRVKEDLYDPLLFEFPMFQYYPVLSRSGAEWTGFRGHVQDVTKQVIDCLSQSIVYACGSNAMITSAKVELIAGARLSQENFYADAFVSSAT